VGSALIRLISAAPRGVTANRRSSATTFGLRRVISSSARSASPSENASTSPFIDDARSVRPGRKSRAPITTVQVSMTVFQFNCRTSLVAQSVRMSSPSYRDCTVGDLLTNLARTLPSHDALVYARGPRFTFRQLEDEARTIARGFIALGVDP